MRFRTLGWSALAWGIVAAGMMACDSSLDQPPTTVGIADSADQIAFGITHYLTMEGLRRARLEADTAYFYQGPQSADMIGVRVTFYSLQGEETSTLTSNEGTYYWRTGDMEARGNVIGVTPDGRRLETSILEYTSNDNRINGSEPFVYTTSTQRIEGGSFTSDPDFRDLLATQPRGTVGRVDVERQ